MGCLLIKMDNFLDTCILISRFDDKDKYYETICIFLDDPEDKIISTYQEKKEIPMLFLRKKKIIREAILYLKDSNHLVDFANLTNREKISLKSLLAQISLKKETEDSLKQKLGEIILLERKVLAFIQTKISRKIIPIDSIDENLVKLIKKRNQNKADSKIIASAIQEHQKNNLIAFTLDKKDWKINSVKRRIEDLGYKCPDVRFLR